MTTKIRKRYHVMTGIGQSGRNRIRSIGSRAHKASAERLALMFGPLVWVSRR